MTKLCKKFHDICIFVLRNYNSVFKEKFSSSNFTLNFIFFVKFSHFYYLEILFVVNFKFHLKLDEKQKSKTLCGQDNHKAYITYEISKITNNFQKVLFYFHCRCSYRILDSHSDFHVFKKWMWILNTALDLCVRVSPRVLGRWISFLFI